MVVLTLTDRVQRSIEKHAFVPRGGRVVVAVSGGADSVALLRVLRDLEAGGTLVVAGVAHLNHQLRGEESDADEAFCRALAAEAAVPAIVEREDIGARARRDKRSIEDAARQARLAFFARAAAHLNADAVAVAHTMDDQAETVLLRLLRGAGTRGLAAIHPRRGVVVRPLLDIRRADLREYLASRGAAFREDSSNSDLHIPRNRLRHTVLPLLEAEFGDAIPQVLARAAALARQDEEFLAALAIDLARSIVLTTKASAAGEPIVVMDAVGLAAAPPALGSRIVLAELERLAPERPVSFDQVEALLRLARGGAPHEELSLAGGRAERIGDTVALFRGQESDPGNAFEFSLSIPGEVELPMGVAVGAAPAAGPAAGGRRPTEWVSRGLEVGVAAEALVLPLAVRNRRPGDMFWPLGAQGARKLQDFLVDRKIPRGERDRLPLVVDADGRIIWVPGHAVSETVRVRLPSAGVILLSVRHLGGAG